jgi:hypothetical protein
VTKGKSTHYSDRSQRTSVVSVADWEEFERVVKTLEDPSRKVWDEVWFRGQAHAEWPLHTTLERRSPNIRSVGKYLNLIGEIKPAIETFTGASFSMPKPNEIVEMCHEYDRFEFQLRNCAVYLAHLRHCGFPSPMLDWSHSPYVAAYFAFAHAKHNGSVAIYAYQERPVNFKIGDSDLPQIITFGPNVRTHNPTLQGLNTPLTTTIQLGTLGGDIYQLPLSANGLKDLARVIAGLDEAKQILGVSGNDKDPVKH